jgi:hypothetical protein
VLHLDGDLSLPSAIPRFPRNAFVTAHIVIRTKRIVAILGMSTFAQIVSSIVQRIVVFVIANLPYSAIKNHPVHGGISVADESKSIKTSIHRIEINSPIPLVQPIEISDINYRISATCKGNKTVRCIVRLGNFVSMNTIFHRSSFKGLNSAAF